MHGIDDNTPPADRKGCSTDPTAYLPTLISEFRALPPSERPLTPREQAALDRCTAIATRYEAQVARNLGLAAADPDTPEGRPLTLDDTAVLELSLLELLPQARLESKKWSLEKTYGWLIGRESFESYANRQQAQAKSTHPSVLRPGIRHTPRDILLAQMQDMVVGKHWLYQNEAKRGSSLRDRQRDLGFLFLGGLVAVLVTTLPLLLCLGSPRPAVGWLAVVALLVAIGFLGLTGATISTLQRVKKVLDVPIAARDPSLSLTDLFHGRMSVMVSALSGVISAYFLYLLFLAGGSNLVSGLTPTFAGSGNTWLQAAGLDLLVGLFPNSIVDYGKLFVWCIVAGFAERLVPDVLDRLATPPAAKR